MILEQKYLLSLFYHRYIVTYATTHCKKKKSICEMRNRNPDFSRDVTQ